MGRFIEKFNILHIDTEEHLGGGEKQLKFLVDNLDSDVNSTLALRDALEIKDFFKGRRDCYFLNFHGSFDILSLLKLKKIIKKNRINIIHAHTGLAANYAFVLKPFVDKIVATRRVSIPIRNWLSKKKYASFDKIIVVSQSIKKQLYFLDKSKVEWIESALDEKFLECPTREDAINMLHLNRNNMYICNIGKIEEMKGQAYLIEALSLIKKENIGNVKLLIAGRGNITKLKQLADKMSVAEDVIFLGFINDTRYVYKASSICVVSSIFGEGSSAAIKEALACKTPVIATNVGGAEFLVGENGIIIRPKSALDIKDAVIALMKNEKKLNNSFDARIFAPKRMAEQYKFVYESLYK